MLPPSLSRCDTRELPMSTVADIEADREHAHKALGTCAAEVDSIIAWRAGN